MKTFTKTYDINASLDKVWYCLTNENEMNEWGAEPSSFVARTGHDFKMWGDYLNGKVNEIVEQSRLVEDWQVDGMSEPSKVIFELTGDDTQTSVVLTHSNVPDHLADELSEGWDVYYLGAIKEYLEN